MGYMWFCDKLKSVGQDNSFSICVTSFTKAPQEGSTNDLLLLSREKKVFSAVEKDEKSKSA